MKPDELRDKMGPGIRLRTKQAVESGAQLTGGQERLAELMGMKANALSARYSPKKQPNRDLFFYLALCKLINISFTWLIFGKGEMGNSGSSNDEDSGYDIVNEAFIKMRESKKKGRKIRKAVGACPHCGARIFSDDQWNGDKPPEVIYSCDCRNRPLSSSS